MARHTLTHAQPGTRPRRPRPVDFRGIVLGMVTLLIPLAVILIYSIFGRGH